MATVTLIAATLAALVLAAVGVQLYLLVKRLRQVVSQVEEMMGSRVGPTIDAVGETVRSAQGAVTTLDEGLGSLARTLDRADRVTAQLEPDSVARTVIQPMVAKVLSWVSGVRKGLRSQRRSAPGETQAGAGPDTEAG